MTVNYREAYGIFACSGILFNHESKRRGETFVSRKITRGLSNICLGNQEVLLLGNVNAKRDWGHAKDYVAMQWLMLQQDDPEDFVIATGEQRSVRDFVNAAADELGLTLDWQGEGLNQTVTVGAIDPFKAEQYIHDLVGKTIIKIDSRYFRPTEVESLLGDASKAKQKLSWQPSISFSEMVSEMVSYDLDKARRFQLLRKQGFAVDLNDGLE